MVRFGVLSATFWSIGVDLVAGAVFKEVCWVSKFAVSYGLAGEFLDENSDPYGLGDEFFDENSDPYGLGHEFLDEYSPIRRENAWGPRLGRRIPRRK